MTRGGVQAGIVIHCANRKDRTLMFEGGEGNGD